MRATQYFTPLFEPNSQGRLRSQDRRACLNIEGSCVVGDYLYNNGMSPQHRDDIVAKFGFGSGRSSMNQTNALDPCRTIAADHRYHPVGTVIYIPSMEGKICPQTGKPIDGCFIVGDKGKGIKGRGRFDLFTGECADYNKRNNTCRDSLNIAFVPQGDEFYIVGKHNARAKALREEADLHIRSGWSSNPLIPSSVANVFQIAQ